jgi:CubicO group peptidase (beta-lactamase class C family)
MAKGDSIFFEKYWKPFNADFLHRMYSVSKSFVSIAIGFLIQDGKISIDDDMEKYFSEELKNWSYESWISSSTEDKEEIVQNVLDDIEFGWVMEEELYEVFYDWIEGVDETYFE